MLALIVANLTMIAVAVAQYPPFFYQPGARIFVLESASVLVAYAVAALWIGRSKSASWDAILRVATLFGILGGIVETLNIALENVIPAIHTPALPIAFMLVIFTSWGVAGFRMAPLSQLSPCGRAHSGFKRGHLYAPRCGRWFRAPVLRR